MKKILKRFLMVFVLLLVAAGGLWYWFFGYRCRSYEPVFHERWSEAARKEWQHLDYFLRHDAVAAAPLMQETGLVGKDMGVLSMAGNISAMLELVEYAAEHGELKADDEGDECRVRKARLSHLLVVGGYLHIVDDLFVKTKSRKLFSVPETSHLTQPDVCLLTHLIHGIALAYIREESPFTPLPERWELVKKVLSTVDSLPADVVEALASLSMLEHNPEFALYGAQQVELTRVQKIFYLTAGLRMENGGPLVQHMMETGCPTEYDYRDGRKWCLKSDVKWHVCGKDTREKLEYLCTHGYISADDVDAVLNAKKAQKK